MMSSFSNPCVAVLYMYATQNDFFPGGTCPLEGAEAALEVVNAVRKRTFDVVFVCGTHRPPNYVYGSHAVCCSRSHECPSVPLTLAD